MQQTPQEPVSSLLYRVDTIEKDLVQVKSQLTLYEPATYNDLKLQRINDTLARIEMDMSKVKDEFGAMNTRMTSQDKDLQMKDAAQRESQNALQIRTLIFIVSTVVTILVAVLIGYITHFFH